MVFYHEFKKFISRGNIIDIAIGFILGAAFSKISSSLVVDIISPPLGFLIERVKFTELKIVLREATEKSAEVAILYGKFIQSVIEFFIVGFALFLIMKFITALIKKEEPKKAAPPVQSDEAIVLKEIRDILKQKARS